MKKTLTVDTTKEHQLIDITDEVLAAVADAQGDTFAHVYTPHTTASILINENEERLIADCERVIGVLLEAARPFKHDGRDGPNGEGHAFSWLHGCEKLIPIDDGKLQLGHLQRIYFVETSGPRHRTVEVRVLGQ
ncbi:MAG: secondary thiamine-phosphate synthase enzyme YjbQ [Propionibacteriaceae bacterium]|jgi:secondary thiamine-phosphate synthase enzyme|nr:secondary thiamine-phosphate synthase enzyme YjbQ [Propionibacteriaceae bacterium]